MNPLLANDVRDIVAKAMEATPAPKVPATLYHYTTTAGMLGILDSKKIWATHVKYLNDASELTYATALLDTVLDEHVAAARLVHTQEFLRRLKGISLLDMFDCFVACFCEHGDLLNQWRVYTNKDGYALGFKASSLEEVDPAIGLCKIVYNQTLQRDLLGNVLSPLLIFLDRELVDFDVMSKTHVSALNAVRFDLQHTLAGLLAAFKDPSFEVEHEWRLIYGVAGDFQRCKFRAGQFGLTPYREFELEGSATPFPLTTVRHGPGSHPENTKGALERLLLSKSMSGVVVCGTELPVRV